MAKLGSAVSNEFSIGTAELRAGPLTEAGKLPQSRSIGLIDNVTISSSNTSVDLKGLFPQVIVDTAVVEQIGSVKAASREFSRRNLNLMLGNAVEATNPTDVATTLTADVAAAGLVFAVASVAGLAVDDVVLIYPEGRPEDITVTQIESIAALNVTVKTGLGAVVAYPAATDSTRDYHFIKGHAIAVGNVTKTNYFSISTIQQKNSTGRPVNWIFWKVANSGSMEQNSSATDYATLNMEFKVLAPSLTDIGVGGDLNNVADFVTAYPSGMRVAGADQ